MHRNWNQIRCVPASVVLAVCISFGCSKSGARPSSAPIYPVEGRLFVGVTPAFGAVVSFHSDRDAPIITTKVRDDGRFVPVQADGAIGLPEGEYSLTATWPDATTDRFAGKHADPKKPIARLQVKPGVNRIPPIRLPSTVTPTRRP